MARAHILLVAILTLALGSCGINWEKRATVVSDTVLRANPKVSLADNNLGAIARMEGLTLTGKTAVEGTSRFLEVKRQDKKGWVLEAICIKGSEPGIVTGRPRTAYKDRPDGVPVGFLEPATLVVVKRGKKVEKPVHALALESGRWKDIWIDGDSLSTKAEDIEIFTVVKPVVDGYRAKAEADTKGEGKKQLELAQAYLNDVEVRYQKSEFYPETIAKYKSEIKELLGAAGSATEKILDTDTNNSYEIKR